MSKKYLDNNGLQYFWTKIKNYIDSHITGTKVPTAGTTAMFDTAKHMNSEDMTDEEITNFIDKIPGGSSLLDYEVVPVTLTNGYTLASWGYIKAYRFGHICMLTFSGLKRSTATTSNTQFASIPLTAMENMTTSIVDGAGDTAIVQAMKGTSELYINAANANTYYFGQLIFIVRGTA